VAKPLVDQAVRAGGARPVPPAVDAADLGTACLAALLSYREASLAADLGAELAAAGSAKAAAAAFDANLDRVVSPAGLGPSPPPRLQPNSHCSAGVRPAKRPSPLCRALGRRRPRPNVGSRSS
jgi:hypothetical protein